MLLLGRQLGPQGLKPAFLAGLSGTAEAVPYPKPIYETSSMHSAVNYIGLLLRSG